MHWTEPADSTDSHSELETRLWAAANQLWANEVLDAEARELEERIAENVAEILEMA